MEMIAEEAHRMQLLFEDKIRELISERDSLAGNLEDKEVEI